MLFKTLFRTFINYCYTNKNGSSGDGGNHILHVQRILKLLILSIWLKAPILQISFS